jgi:hypothetical protein
MASYYAKYRAVPPNDNLLGAVKESQSSRYQSRQMAIDYLENVIELNGGLTKCDGEVWKSPKHPEIFIHCGEVATVVNTRCPRCKKVLTLADAKAAKSPAEVNLFVVGSKVRCETNKHLHKGIQQGDKGVVREYYPKVNAVDVTFGAKACVLFIDKREVVLDQ